MKMNIKGSFKDKKFKYGGYATMMTAIVIAIAIVVNLVIGKFDWKLDLTKNKMFSLSDQTDKVITGLKQDVTIIGFYQSGKEDKIITEILNKYKTRSNKVTVEYKDPILYPQFAQKYSKNGEEVQEGSIVVESGNKFKLIGYNDLVNYDYQNPDQPTPQSLTAEQAVTGAILYVTSDKNPVIYTLEGHGEKDLSPELTKQIESENYTLKGINLLTNDVKLEKGDMLLVVSPQKDLTADESQKLKDFLGNGGRSLFMMDVVKDNLPNFSAVLNSYGVGLQKSIAVEGDKQHSANVPVYLMPELNSHEIVNPLLSNKLTMFVPVAQPIDILKVKKSSLDIEPLLSTTKNSWAKKNLDATTLEKEAGDLTGPFNIAVAITDNVDTANTDKNAKLVVIGSAAFTSSQFVSQSNSANIDFVMNSFNWLQDKKDSISIRPKDLTSEYLNINGFQQLLFSGVVVIIIPLIIAISGIAVWSRRRNK